MEISRMFPGKYHLQTVQQFHCHVQLKGPFFNWGLRPGGMVQVKGLKGDAVGDAQFIESVWQTSSLRFFHFKTSGSTTFFFYKNWGQYVMNTWNFWRWLLTFHHCLGEIWDCLIRHGWGPAFEWWEGRRDAQGFFGLTWPQKQSSL